MVISPYDKYKKAKIETASQGKLILMLYDGAIRFLNHAKVSLEDKRYDVVNNNLIKAQEILTELMLSLNMSVGDIAKNLYSLYDFMYRKLIEANVKKDSGLITEIRDMLQELKGAWEEGIKKLGEKVLKT
ncbi:MAG: flagellar export chaperone FliS [bacterium]|nr:flagellar export chaperone FliS [bacterium]